MGSVVVGSVIALVVGVFLLWKKILGKPSILLLFIAGSGIGGLAAQAVARMTAWTEGFAGRLLGLALGASFSGLIALGLALLVIHDLWPKKKPSNVRLSAVAAFLLPFFALGAGGAFAEVIQSVGDGLAGAVSTFTELI